MIKVVEPKDHCYYRSRIDIFMQFLALQDNFYLSREELSKATFIIAEKEAGDVYGGAILHKKYVSDLRGNIKKALLTVISEKAEVWSCTPFICLEHHSLAHDKDKFVKTFYSELLKIFLEFGNHEKISFLCFRLNKDEYLRSMNAGGWSYALQTKSKDSPDGFLYGILSLNGVKGEQYKRSQDAA